MLEDRLYLFDCPSSGVFKVGISNDVKRRLSEIVSQGYKIETETSFYTGPQDRKQVLELEKIIKYLLRDYKAKDLSVDKQSGYSEWYVSNTVLNHAVVKYILELFDKTLSLSNNFDTLSYTVGSGVDPSFSNVLGECMSELVKLDTKVLACTLEAYTLFIKEVCNNLLKDYTTNGVFLVPKIQTQRATYEIEFNITKEKHSELYEFVSSMFFSLLNSQICLGIQKVNLNTYLGGSVLKITPNETVGKITINFFMIDRTLSGDNGLVISDKAEHDLWISLVQLRRVVGLLNDFNQLRDKEK